jgi:hypothetical protein
MNSTPSATTTPTSVGVEHLFVGDLVLAGARQDDGIHRRQCILTREVGGSSEVSIDLTRGQRSRRTAGESVLGRFCRGTCKGSLARRIAETRYPQPPKSGDPRMPRQACNHRRRTPDQRPKTPARRRRTDCGAGRRSAPRPTRGRRRCRPLTALDGVMCSRGARRHDFRLDQEVLR